MADGWYRLSLIVTHPRRSPDEVTAQLKLDPDECWHVGSAKLARGLALPKRQKSSGWRKVLFETFADDLKPPKAIERVLIDLKESEAFFRQIADEGGQATLEVFGDWVNMSQVVFKTPLMEELAAFRMELVLW